MYCNWYGKSILNTILEVPRRTVPNPGLEAPQTPTGVLMNFIFGVKFRRVGWLVSGGALNKRAPELYFHVPSASTA